MFRKIKEYRVHRKNNEIKVYCFGRKCKESTYHKILSEEIALRVIQKNKRTRRYCRIGIPKYYLVPYYVCECLECGHRRRVVKYYERISKEKFDKLKETTTVFNRPIF